MGVFKNIMSRIRSFLSIQEPSSRTYNLTQALDWQGVCIRNNIWYRGDEDELMQFYKQVPSDAARYKFWAAVPMSGREIEKIHTGLPGVMVDLLTSLIVADINDIHVTGAETEWTEVERELQIKQLVNEAVSETLVLGDGAFRISILPHLSSLPIVEFIPGDRCEYVYDHGHLIETIFRTDITDERKNHYTLVEHYGRGYIRTKLYKGDREVDLSSTPETENLQPEITWTGDFSMAVPIRFWKSKKFKNRGASIYDTKTGAFDAFDEIFSQWMDALRQGRTKTYIPADLIPRNPETGALMKPTAFDNAYIQMEPSLREQAQSQIEVVQPDIPHDSYLATYITALDLCLQGIISPSTLGIDTKKVDNAEAQREKEKATLYTRQQIIETLQTVVPELIKSVIWTLQTSRSQAISQDITVDVPFGEYASPSFEATIETVAKARAAHIMSIEAAVDEIYGDTRDDQWKEQECKRLRDEEGLLEYEEPAVNLSTPEFPLNIEETE